MHLFFEFFIRAGAELVIRISEGGYGLMRGVKTCGKAENDEAKSGNDEAKGVPGRRGVTEGDGR